MGEDPGAIREDIAQTRERMGDTVDALAYKGDVKARAKDSVTGKFDAVKATVSGVTDAAPDTDDVKQSARKAVGVAQENPLGLAIGAVAVGFLAGMLVPSTRVENERVGPIADQVKDEVKQAAQTAMEHGKEAAQDAAQAAGDAIKETGQQHAEEAKADLQGQARETKEHLSST